MVLVDGKLVENLHVENARRLVALAEAIEALEAEIVPPISGIKRSRWLIVKKNRSERAG